MARRAIHVTDGPARPAHADPREPEQLGVRAERRGSEPFELGGGRAGEPTFRLPRRLSYRRRGVFTLDADQVGRWLRSENPRQVDAASPPDGAAKPVRWGGAIGERHVAAVALAQRRSAGLRSAIARLTPWAGHPGMTLAVWWELCFPGRGLGLPAPVREPSRPNPWLGPLHSLRWNAMSVGVHASTERELSSRLTLERSSAWLRHVAYQHLRFIEVWFADDHDRHLTFTLDESPLVELLIRTLCPLHVTGPGVDLRLDPHQIALLRCTAGGWRLQDPPPA